MQDRGMGSSVFSTPRAESTAEIELSSPNSVKNLGARVLNHKKSRVKTTVDKEKVVL